MTTDWMAGYWLLTGWEGNTTCLTDWLAGYWLSYKMATDCHMTHSSASFLALLDKIVRWYKALRVFFDILLKTVRWKSVLPVYWPFWRRLSDDTQSCQFLGPFGEDCQMTHSSASFWALLKKTVRWHTLLPVSSISCWRLSCDTQFCQFFETSGEDCQMAHSSASFLDLLVNTALSDDTYISQFCVPPSDDYQ